MAELNERFFLDLLAAKHSSDVFVEHCTAGSRRARRLDAWALRPSWTPITMIGYEIKCSRHDFLRDNKWQEYLSYCNQLYFVSPPDIIRQDELPSDVGLMHLSADENGLRTIRKAVHRKIEPPTRLLCSVLMNRAEIRGAGLPQQASLNGKGDNELAELRAKLTQYQHLHKKLVDHGVDPDEEFWRVSGNMDKLLRKIPPTLKSDIRRLGDLLKKLEEQLS